MGSRLEKSQQTILLGMSGGVDSSVTGLLLKEQGFVVQGIFLDLFSDEKSAQAYSRARDVGQQLGIEVEKIDLKKEFKKEVINPFVEDYRQGLTPNPCVMCNARFKFRELLKLADERGVKWVATGHYARLEYREESIILKKGLDNFKDQSYFLYRLSQSQLARIKFPLGELEKSKVKKIAKECDLKSFSSESQDVCFFGKDQTLADFLAHEQLRGDSGDIVDEKGVVIGQHGGAVFYTVGQRKGLGLGGDGPYFVLEKDVRNNRLIVTNQENHPRLFAGKFQLAKVNWITPEVFDQTELARLTAKIRYLGQAVSLKSFDLEASVFELAKPVWAAAVGQSMVIYDEDRVIGGGVINKVLNE